MKKQSKPSKFTRHQMFQLGLMFGALLFLCVLMYFVGRPLVQFVSEPEYFRDWVESKGILGVLAFIGMVILQVFLFVRKFGMKFVELFVSKEKIESVRFLKSSRKSESIIFLFFLIPGTPKDLLSYLVGLTDMKVSHWIFICAVGRFPAIFLSVLSGSALGTENYTIAVAVFAVLIVLYMIGLIVYRFHNRKQ